MIVIYLYEIGSISCNEHFDVMLVVITRRAESIPFMSHIGTGRWQRAEVARRYDERQINIIIAIINRHAWQQRHRTAECDVTERYRK